MKTCTAQHSTAQHSTAQHRDSNLELYRILLMLAIIAHHYVVNSGLMPECIAKEPTSGRSIFFLLFGAWGKTGINCFLMITGYFMCQSQISLNKFLKLVFAVEFYKIIFFIIFLATGNTVCNLRTIRGLLPVPGITNGFISCFLVFFLFIPFLNLFIHSLSKRNYQLLLGFLLFFYTFLPSFIISIRFNYVTWFSIIYLIAAYIRLYPIPLFSNRSFWFYSSIACILTSCASVLFFALIFKKSFFWFLADSNKILAVATSISLFLFFKNIKLKYNPIINTLASSVFGVLLIHANSNAMRQWLWADTLQNTRFFDSPWLVLHAFGSVIGIYLICTAIDQVRIHLIEKPFFHHFGDTIERIQTKLMNIGTAHV